MSSAQRMATASVRMGEKREIVAECKRETDSASDGDGGEAARRRLQVERKVSACASYVRKSA